MCAEHAHKKCRMMCRRVLCAAAATGNVVVGNDAPSVPEAPAPWVLMRGSGMNAYRERASRQERQPPKGKDGKAGSEEPVPGDAVDAGRINVMRAAANRKPFIDNAKCSREMFQGPS